MGMTPARTPPHQASSPRSAASTQGGDPGACPGVAAAATRAGRDAAAATRAGRDATNDATLIWSGRSSGETTTTPPPPGAAPPAGTASARVRAPDGDGGVHAKPSSASATSAVRGEPPAPASLEDRPRCAPTGPSRSHSRATATPPAGEAGAAAAASEAGAPHRSGENGDVHVKPSSALAAVAAPLPVAASWFAATPSPATAGVGFAATHPSPTAGVGRADARFAGGVRQSAASSSLTSRTARARADMEGPPPVPLRDDARRPPRETWEAQTTAQWPESSPESHHRVAAHSIDNNCCGHALGDASECAAKTVKQALQQR